MNTDTLKTKVEYGHKAHKEAERLSDSTYMKVNKKIDIRISYSNGDCFDSGFRKVDFSEQQKKITFRKINKMLGGY